MFALCSNDANNPSIPAAIAARQMEKQTVQAEIKLTKGQRAFLKAVDADSAEQFHVSVIEPCERMGLVQFIGGTFRLVGRNAYPARCFARAA